MPRITASHRRQTDPESERRAPDALPADGHVEAEALAEGEPLCLAIVANLALDQLSAELFERRLPRHDLERPFPPQDGDAPLRKVDTARINAFDG